jgi:hypothetical protein
LNVQYDQPLSNSAFNDNFRRYAKAAEINTALAEAQLAVHAAEQQAVEAERAAAQAALNA